MNFAIDYRFLKHNRDLDSTVIRNYMSDNRERLVRLWGEDGVKAGWYLEQVDRHLSILNHNRTYETPRISQDVVAFDVELHARLNSALPDR